MPVSFLSALLGSASAPGVPAASLLLTSGLAADAALLAHFARHLASASSRLPAHADAARAARGPLNALMSTFTLAGEPSLRLQRLASGCSLAPATHGIGEGRLAHTVAAKAGFLGQLPVRNVLGARFAEALRVFAEMDVALNAATLATVRGAREAGAVRVWRAVQGWYVKRERELSPTVGNAVLDMYVKCEKLDSARWMFDRVKSDKVLSTFLSVCASLGSLESGRWEQKTWMYAKCGCLDVAVSIFNKMPFKKVSWNAMINGFSPNEVTFITVLGACCHSGLVQEGRWLFELMTYKLRAGLFEKACDVI
ncbi:hypothetical protein SORBI_3006G128600 [Sorghum bicolor]|uniref:Pentatricopeptide repeat-containing protein n=1 Tax=Sorghum bicolor TaxID=4558 RepID=A0A1B6PLS5_SORBI|nr:hypothetical protein SORBI_3006G128600 [Sorghum bicolor]